MADIRPANPGDLLETAANNIGSFSDIRRDIFPNEIPSGNLPLFGIDPREEEQNHDADDTSGRIYEVVPLQKIVYIAVESGAEASDRASARSSLKTLRGDYLTEMFSVFATQTTNGSAQKTSRLRTDVTQGESIVLVDALTIRIRQLQIYK